MTVQPIIVIVPALAMPPPSPGRMPTTAALPEMVQSVSVSVPELYKPPPNRALPLAIVSPSIFTG